MVQSVTFTAVALQRIAVKDGKLSDGLRTKIPIAIKPFSEMQRALTNQRIWITLTPTSHFSQVRSAVTTVAPLCKPRARHARSPNDRPADLVALRKDAARYACSSSKGTISQGNAVKTWRASSSGIPVSIVLLTISERLIAESNAPGKYSNTACPPGSLKNSAKRAELSKTNLLTRGFPTPLT